MAELRRLVDRKLDDLLRTRMERDLGRRRRRVATADHELDRSAHLRELEAKRVEHARGQAIAFADEPEQQVLGSDVVVVEANGLVLPEREDALRPDVEAVERSHLYLALGARWQRRQWNVPRPPTTVRRISAPQREQGSPSRTYASNSRCMRPRCPFAST